MKFIALALTALALSPLARAKSAAELNKSRMARTPSSDLYQSDNYVIGVVNGTDAMKALKTRYKECKLLGVVVGEPNEHLVPKTVRFECKSKNDGLVQVSASTEVAGWGETSDITITIQGIQGASN